ncbi:hypothetical protein X474_04420 [Dethiosulfatarculus sandiegensis]|uniref:Uncharacterized protein n=1 Tax=Dethiosulfatarculus sandiegensis TaxID=1429043 RepID=A0A0D2GLE5_9BACT|nr:hypothetical protein X474_04420 [Dethiosulfatarculus sandiegensis]
MLFSFSPVPPKKNQKGYIKNPDKGLKNSQVN